MIKGLRQLLKNRSTELYVCLVLLWLLPGIALIVLGVIYLFNAGWLLWFSLGLVILALLTFVVRIFLRKREQEKTEALTHLDPVPEWSGYDKQIWAQSLTHIADAHLFTTPWEEIPQAMLDQLTFVARLYHKDDPDAQYAFSVPELLLMLETWSREYRADVLERVPVSQNIKISTLRSLNRKTLVLQKIYKFGGPLISLVRIGLDPAGGITSEIRSRLFSEVSGGFGEHMQKNMKQTLFEQVTQVAIDLYSGRLKLSEKELAAYRQAQKPAEESIINPLSVMVIGQVNAGKSSLINQLKEQSVAEVDVLPSTAGFHRFRTLLNEKLEIVLMDTPGLDGSEKTAKALLNACVSADLVLWLSQANQPAKDLDRKFLEQFNAYFLQQYSRKKPPVVLVSTHNDMLFATGRWRPPYDLTDAGDGHSLKMLEALNYIHSAIGFSETSPMIPISLAPDHEPYNVDVLREALLSVTGEARAAQLNRERLQAAELASVVRKGLRQTAGLLKWGVNNALK